MYSVHVVWDMHGSASVANSSLGGAIGEEPKRPSRHLSIHPHCDAAVVTTTRRTHAEAKRVRPEDGCHSGTCFRSRFAEQASVLTFGSFWDQYIVYTCR